MSITGLAKILTWKYHGIEWFPLFYMIWLSSQTGFIHFEIVALYKNTVCRQQVPIFYLYYQTVKI